MSEILYMGCGGRNVGALQRALNDSGVVDPLLTVDEDFGPATDAAVRALQAHHGLVVDGFAGPATWAALADDPTMPVTKPGNIHSIVSNGQDLLVPTGKLTNFRAAGVYEFLRSIKDRKGTPVDQIVLHESTSRSRADTVRGWDRPRQGSRGPYWIGVHFSIDADGLIHQHLDAAQYECVHGGPHNRHSVAIEIINPYYPQWNNASTPWQETIDAPWADRLRGQNNPPRYVLPTHEQLESLAQLVRVLTSVSPSPPGLNIPRYWIGLDEGKLRFARVDGAMDHQSGLLAHGYYAHADGWFPMLYCAIRLLCGVKRSRAYEAAKLAATGIRWEADLSPWQGGPQ